MPFPSPALPEGEIAIAPALAQMVAKAGIEIGADEDGKPVVLGVALKEVRSPGRERSMRARTTGTERKRQR